MLCTTHFCRWLGDGRWQVVQPTKQEQLDPDVELHVHAVSYPNERRIIIARLFFIRAVSIQADDSQHVEESASHSSWSHTCWGLVTECQNSLGRRAAADRDSPLHDYYRLLSGCNGAVWGCRAQKWSRERSTYERLHRGVWAGMALMLHFQLVYVELSQ